MNIQVMGLSINYKLSGQGRDALILHGWGANIQAVEPIHSILERGLRVCSVDLPGFGKSQEPPEAWDVYSYAKFVAELCRLLNIKNPILIGHSFGGRLCIILAAQRLMAINKIILVDSAGILPKRRLDYYIKVYTYKTAKKAIDCVNIFSKGLSDRLKARFGSADYKNASQTMKKIMVRVVNEDLTYLLKDIDKSTLLIWGEKDDATPVEDGRLMEKLIPDAGLVVLNGAGHFSYLERLGDFTAIILKYLENDLKGGQ